MPIKMMCQSLSEKRLCYTQLCIRYYRYTEKTEKKLLISNSQELDNQIRNCAIETKMEINENNNYRFAIDYL